MNWSVNKTIIALAALAAAVFVLFRMKKCCTEKQIKKGEAAMRELVKRYAAASKAGKAFTGEQTIIRSAMKHPTLGDIDFRWGHFDDKTGGGSGTGKIINAMRLKREYYADTRFSPRQIYRVPGIIMHGKPSKQGNRVVLMECEKSECDIVVLETTTLDGKPTPHWVFNAFPQIEGKTKSTKDVLKELKKQKKGGPVAPGDSTAAG